MSDEAIKRMRAKLEARLDVEIVRIERRRRRWRSLQALGAACLVLGGATYALSRLAPSRFAGVFMMTGHAAALPMAAVTPGAVDDVSARQLCAGEPRPARAITRDVRDEVLASYHMADVSPSEYELDYLITPELGGANDRRNLWPQRYASPVWNARIKDHLEVLLPRLVCAGQVDLKSAQQEIADNWIAAYKKYFRTDQPLPTHGVAVEDDDDAPVILARLERP
jgi:hypothetical protein